MEFLIRKRKKFEELENLAKGNSQLQRRLSRYFFFSSVLGGIGFFFVLAGRSKTITWPKVIVFCYGINHIMKASGIIGLMIAVDE